MQEGDEPESNANMRVEHGLGSVDDHGVRQRFLETIARYAETDRLLLAPDRRIADDPHGAGDWQVSHNHKWGHYRPHFYRGVGVFGAGASGGLSTGPILPCMYR
jgi:hypothetical protein